MFPEVDANWCMGEPMCNSTTCPDQIQLLASWWFARLVMSYYGPTAMPPNPNPHNAHRRCGSFEPLGSTVTLN